MFNKKNTSRIIIVLSGSMLATPSHVLAQTLIKSVDAKGNVTYSDKPVPEAKTISEIPLHPGPGKSEVNAAKELAEKQINATQKIESEDKKPNRIPTQKLRAEQQDNDNSNTQYGVPYRARPRLRPPSQRPGIRPPPVHRPARPSGGRGR